MQSLVYHHVDVFSHTPFSGNSLAVFPESQGLDRAQMLAITQELRHFESIFLSPTDAPFVLRARIFDLFDELDFAGHPVLGAACVMHDIQDPREQVDWTFFLNARTVQVRTRRAGAFFQAELDQGAAEFLSVVDARWDAPIAAALALSPTQLDARFRPEVISTGLRYLVVPVTSAGLARARIPDEAFVPLLDALGAQFVYALDVDAVEGRHWNHVGGLEDVATGSGAGCVAAFLRKHALLASGERRTLHQGRFTGRASRIHVCAEGEGTRISSVRVAGDVVAVGRGQLDALPGKAK